MMQFMAKQNTACSDASACAPAACAASACAADTAVICKDTAILAVSFFIIATVAVSICLSVLGLRGLLVLLVLAWGLVIMDRIIANKFKSAKSNGEMNLAAAAR